MRSVTFQKTEIIPNKIVCVGKNYAAHIEEMGSVPSDQMAVFMKPNACISDKLVAHRGEQIHFETEICLLIQGGAVAGVGVGLDLTKRATRKKSLRMPASPGSVLKPLRARQCSATLSMHRLP